MKTRIIDPEAPQATTAVAHVDVPHGLAPTAEQVGEATETLFVPDLLGVHVRGVVHTVPNAGQHLIAYTRIVDNANTLLVNAIPGARSIQIISHATGSDYVNVNGRPMSAVTDGAGRFANGGGDSFDVRGPLYAWATADTIAVSVFIITEDG